MKVKAKYADRTDEQATTVKNMIARILPPESSVLFDVLVNVSIQEDGHDVFILQTTNEADENHVLIIGSSGVAAAWGFHYYIKVYCKAHISWSGVQLALPKSLPVVDGVKIVSNDYFRYYQNVCTVSYSSVWWNWTRWEQEIDWMALNGINLPLAFTGQEEIFRRVYLKLNFTQNDLDEFFAGPAFEAWGRMGNIDGWGGPIPENWYIGQIDLQHQILKRMREFGMTPVLPAFSGHVPRAIVNLYPNANVTQLDDWNGFNETYCCSYLLDFNDPLFQTIGSSFIVEMMMEFDVDHIYNCDTFNEMTPPSSDLQYLSNASASVFNAMTAADPEAIWLMQGWAFLNSFWNTTLVKALVTGVPSGRMLILDLHSDVEPLYQRFDSYYGQPFIWCMLHNFGGTKGLFGSISNVNSGPFKGRSFPNSTMVGTGLTPEGIEQNDIMYEFMNEMAWRTEPVDDLEVWAADYTERRYAVRNENVTTAWKSLLPSAYNCSTTNFHGEFRLVSRPALWMASVVCYNDPDLVLDAWDKYISASEDTVLSSSDLYQHDLIDISREGIILVSEQMYEYIILSYLLEDETSFVNVSNQFLDLIADMERLLATDRRFLLGVWLESAKKIAVTEKESTQYEYNARNQITLWGPSGEILDYATKQWSGVVADYYLKRWQLFIQFLTTSFETGIIFNQTEFNHAVFNQAEEPFTFDKKIYPTTSTGDPVTIAKEVHSKWRTVTYPRSMPIAYPHVKLQKSNYISG